MPNKMQDTSRGMCRMIPCSTDVLPYGSPKRDGASHRVAMGLEFVGEHRPVMPVPLALETFLGVDAALQAQELGELRVAERSICSRLAQR